MPWVKLDDQFYDNPKARAAGRDGRELYVAGLCYSAGQLTDGYIPEAAVALIAAKAEVRKSVADRLVDVGLWEPVFEANGAENAPKNARKGFQIHDFHDWNSRAADVKAKRAKERDKKQRQRRSDQGTFEFDQPLSLGMSPGDNAGDNGARPPGSPGDVPTVPSRPVPSRPTRTSDVSEEPSSSSSAATTTTESDLSAELYASPSPDEAAFVDEVLREASARRLEQRNAETTGRKPPITDPARRKKWITENIGRGRAADLDKLALRWHRTDPDLTVDDVADILEPQTAKARR